MDEQQQGAFEMILGNQLQVLEQQVDNELDRLNNLDSDDLESIRKKRMEQMKQAQQQKKDWVAAGHGEYTEISEEKEFFDTCKRSQRVVCQFYCDSFFRCKIVDKHLSALAPKHMEAKFCKINAEKSPFLTERLNIRVIPTIAIVVNGTTVDYIRGFDDLGATDEFPTAVLEARLAKSTVISVPEAPKETAAAKKPPQNLRGAKKGNNSDSDDDW